MGKLLRWENVGATFAEDFGSNNKLLDYSGTSFVKSPFGRARKFNGTSDEINTNLTLNKTIKTIVIKFYNSKEFTSSSTAEVLIGDRDDSGNYVSLGDVTGSYSEVINLSMGSDRSYISGTLDVGWHNLIFSWTGTRYQIYLDGVAKTTYGSGSLMTGWAIQIGSRKGGLFFEGSIKEVILDERAWTSQEASDYHLNKTFDYDKNILSNWQLDNTDHITDLGFLAKESPNDGTVSGSPTVIDTELGKGLSLNSTEYVGVGSNIAITGNQTFITCFTKTENPVVAYDVCGSYVTGTPTKNRFWVFVTSSNDITARLSKSGVAPIPQISTHLGNADLKIVAHSIDRDNHLLLSYTTAESKTLDISSVDDVSQETFQRIGNSLGSSYSPVKGAFIKFIVLNQTITQTQYLDINHRIRVGDL